VVAPPSVPWWPPAPGWYWVMSFAAIGLLVLALRALSRWQKNRYRRGALLELRGIGARLDDSETAAPALADLAALLRRTALSAWPREAVASLTGAEWLDFLNHSGNTDAFTKAPGSLLARASFDLGIAQSVEESQRRELMALVRRWIADH